MNASTDPTAPEPSAVVDPSLAQRLVGMEVPALALDSTAGWLDLRDLAGGLLVLFVYPHATGLPDAPVPGWDMIPGARGCTAQACGFRDRYEVLRRLGAKVAGLSVQPLEEQRAFGGRVGIEYPLISDPERRLAGALGLPTFTVGGRTFYRRVTLIAREGRIVKIFSPLIDPERNAVEVASWLEGLSEEDVAR